MSDYANGFRSDYMSLRRRLLRRFGPKAYAILCEHDRANGGCVWGRMPLVLGS